MSYEQVQFIGHAINTGPRWGGPVSKPVQQYVGLEDNARDIQERLRFVSSVLEQLRKHDKVVKFNGASLLRVFVMPEFLFRGSKGAYPVSVQGTDLVTEGLRKIVSDPRWNDWLFCFGSILGTSAPEQKGRPDEIYNYVPFFVGGDKHVASSEPLRIVMKEHLSNIDFVQRAQAAPGTSGLVWERVAHMDADLPRVPRSEVQQRPDDGKCMFDACGFTWGLEVCLDHLEARLRSSVADPKGLDFQLIPSCGMSIVDSAVALRDGWVFNVDGLNANPELVKKGQIVATNHRNAHTALRLVKDGVVSPQCAQPLDRLVLEDDVKALYADTAGEVHVYAPVVPSPRKR